MKILAISDNVLPQMESADYLRRTYSDIELLISCGDMPASYLEFISSILEVPLFYVRGNHDLDYAIGRPGGENLHRQMVTYRGLRFAGLEGCIRYNDGPIQYTSAEMSGMVLGMAFGMLRRRWRWGAGVDVMVTHSPPLGIHDLPDRAHNGFRSFLWLLSWYRPRYLIHGHVDTWDRRRTTVTQYKQSEVININPVKVLTVDERGTVSHGPR